MADRKTKRLRGLPADAEADGCSWYMQIYSFFVSKTDDEVFEILTKHVFL
jgi:hypothetical protein